MQTIQTPLVPWALSQTEPEVGGDPVAAARLMCRYLSPSLGSLSCGLQSQVCFTC